MNTNEKESTPTIWAFNKADESMRPLVYKSITEGKSRFGWSSEERHNLKAESWSEHHSKQKFLLQIQPGDWIVHINTPHYGKCVAAKVISEYDFDAGLKVGDRVDFRHCFAVDTSTLIEFDRNDPNVLPSVNLKPRGRQQRVLATADFLESLEFLKKGTVSFDDEETRGEYHLKRKTEEYLEKIAALIQEMHKSKALESFLCKVFERIPQVSRVKKNGSGWGTDYGTDIILDCLVCFGNIELEQRVVVQVKSYTGKHIETDAVNDIRTGIKRYDAAAGMILTTGEATEALEKAVEEAVSELDKPISLLAKKDLARFVLKHAPDMVFATTATT